MSGTHDGSSIAALIKKILGKFGINVFDVRLYVSDSGGGITAAAAHLGVPRDLCGLHYLDTANEKSGFGDDTTHKATQESSTLPYINGFLLSDFDLGANR